MKLFQGVYTALITPFHQGKVDFDSLGKLVDQQLKGGVNGFVVNGTTAESPTLTQDESFEILKFVKERAKGKARIIFGSGSNNTAKTIETSKKAQTLGAEGLLVVVPYYNKPPQQGLFQHFKAVAESVDVPVMLYNVPGRTVTSLNADTVKALTKIKNIQAIKEATGNMDFGRQVLLSVPGEFIVASGDDETCLELRRLGGQGVVSVCSHIMPTKMSEWFKAEISAALFEEFNQAKPVIASLYITSNPIPVKAAMQILGVIRSDEMRLPLCQLESDQKKTLEAQLKKFSGFLG